LIFWDKQHNYSTSSFYPGFKNSSTNPCSEIAMQGGDSCRLIAINLYSFVKNPFTSEAEFDYDKFYKVTYETQRLMDDLVDLELEAVERIFNKIVDDKEPNHIKQNEIDTWKLLYKNGKKGRRTGLGFTALADTVAAMGVKFDSNDALLLVDKIMKAKLAGEFDSSIDMAITRKPFEIFDPEIEEKSDFIQMLKKEMPAIYERMMTYGRRNISISTVAPTGSLSMLAQTSSGIEPIFLLSYKRRRKVNPSEKKATVAFVDDLGDSFEEFEVIHPKLKTWMHITGNDNVNESPYAGATAPEINWEKRIEMQALVQKYTTHSISSTINLPTDVSLEKVNDIYIESWKQGLKGITVYREGSRSGILVAKDSKQDRMKDSKFDETFAPKRPKRLDAKIVRFQNEYEKWIAVVGLLDGKPYEIFTGKMEYAFNLPQWVLTGWVIKNKDDEGHSRYDFQYCVARTLKQFIPDGTSAIDKKCPECHDPEGLIYEEGCLKCKSCGHSKCG